MLLPYFQKLDRRSAEEHVLRKANVHIISDNICKMMLGKTMAKESLKNNICAYGNAVDSCQGKGLFSIKSEVIIEFLCVLGFEPRPPASSLLGHSDTERKPSILRGLSVREAILLSILLSKKIKKGLSLRNIENKL